MAGITTPHTTTLANHADNYQAGLMRIFSGKPDCVDEDLPKLIAPVFTQWAMQGLAAFPPSLSTFAGYVKSYSLTTSN